MSPSEKKDKKLVQEITGTFLIYALAIDSTMLCTLNAFAAEQVEPTEETLKKTKQFIEFAATQEEAIVMYYASDMILAVNSDASYLRKPKVQSKVGGHFYVQQCCIPP